MRTLVPHLHRLLALAVLICGFHAAEAQSTASPAAPRIKAPTAVNVDGRERTNAPDLTAVPATVEAPATPAIRPAEAPTASPSDKALRVQPDGDAPSAMPEPDLAPEPAPVAPPAPRTPAKPRTVAAVEPLVP